MLKFKHEELMDDINTHKNNIKTLEELLKQKKEHNTMVWELGTLLESVYPYTIRIDFEEVFIRCQDKITPDVYEELFDFIYDVYKEYGYTFDEDGSTNDRFRFTQSGESAIFASISITSCEYKPTGKMIAEMKSDCSVIQG